MRTDDELKQDVIDQLNWEPSVDADAIGVAVKDGIVTLTGYVNSLMGKINAAHGAEKVYGVRGVVQKIEVKLPGSAERTDEDIAKAVADALEWNALVPEGSVKVEVQDGWVVLSGEVDWSYQRNAANDSVCCLIGVKGITNLITITTKPSARPADIKTSIASSFQRHALMDARLITVKVNGDKVILEGTVHSYAEKWTAEDRAWAAPGIHEVENKINISP
jgi:osmotically-inducible protein OsmY